jgi:hypothetical protein
MFHFQGFSMFVTNDYVVSLILAEKAIFCIPYSMLFINTRWNIGSSHIIFPDGTHPVHPPLACAALYHNILYRQLRSTSPEMKVKGFNPIGSEIGG